MSEQKRARPRGSDKAEQEQEKRRRNTEKVAVLGQEDSSVKILEELVFGGEDELLDRLLQVGYRKSRRKVGQQHWKMAKC